MDWKTIMMLMRWCSSCVRQKQPPSGCLHAFKLSGPNYLPFNFLPDQPLSSCLSVRFLFLTALVFHPRRPAAVAEPPVPGPRREQGRRLRREEGIQDSSVAFVAVAPRGRGATPRSDHGPQSAVQTPLTCGGHKGATFGFIFSPPALFMKTKKSKCLNQPVETGFPFDGCQNLFHYCLYLTAVTTKDDYWFLYSVDVCTFSFSA